MGMINAVIKNAHDDALSCDSFTPDWNDVDVIANCAACLTIIELNTKKHPSLKRHKVNKQEYFHATNNRTVTMCHSKLTTKQRCFQQPPVACYVTSISCVLVYVVCAMTLSEAAGQPRGDQRPRDWTPVSCGGYSCVPVGQWSPLQ